MPRLLSAALLGAALLGAPGGAAGLVRAAGARIGRDPPSPLAPRLGGR